MYAVSLRPFLAVDIVCNFRLFFKWANEGIWQKGSFLALILCRELDTFCGFTVRSAEGDNFCYFLFAFPHSKFFQKKDLLLTQQLSSALSSACDFKSHFCNNVDPDQTESNQGLNCLSVCKNWYEKFGRIFSRRHKQTTFSDAGFLGILRVTGNYGSKFFPFKVDLFSEVRQ